MKLPTLFKPKLDPAALKLSADGVHNALVALEARLDAVNDPEATRLVKRLHKQLHKAWQDHAGKVGGDVTAFSGGVKPE